MSECGRWAAVDVTGPDVAYAMTYTLPRRGYALYVRHVIMLVHTVYILLEPRVYHCLCGAQTLAPIRGLGCLRAVGEWHGT